MSRRAITSLKFLASLPLALIIGEMGARIIENGLWPLLFLPVDWLIVIDLVTTVICQIVAFAALIWFWALDR